MTSIQARSIFLLATCAVSLASPFALAETSSAPSAPGSALGPPPPGPPPPGAPASAEKSPSAEHGHPGFVIGLSVGVAVPGGNTTGAAGDYLSNTFGFQVPLTIDLGVNLLPSLFLGAYGTFADGASGSALSETCYQESCSELSFRAGVVVEYRFLPGRTFEPWIGYGAGYDTNTLSQTSPNQFGVTEPRGAKTLNGWDFGHARIGLDFLVDRFSAAGFYADIGFGKYGYESTQVSTEPAVGQNITNQAFHEWTTVGVRWTFMP